MIEQPRRKRGWMNLIVDEVIEETHDTKTFILVDQDDGGRAFDYIAGQYITLRFDQIETKPLVRSYTMSSSPIQKDHVAFTVKRVQNGIVSNWLCDNTVKGDVLRARGPMGKFYFDPTKHHSHLVMVAAGSGVTPFVSIIREYAANAHSDFQFSLLVSFKSTEDLILWKNLQELSNRPYVNIATTLTREERDEFWYGRPSAPLIDRLVDNKYDHKTFMTCGPHALMDMVVNHAREKGVHDSQILTESFT